MASTLTARTPGRSQIELGMSFIQLVANNDAWKTEEDLNLVRLQGRQQITIENCGILSISKDYLVSHTLQYTFFDRNVSITRTHAQLSVATANGSMGTLYEGSSKTLLLEDHFGLAFKSDTTNGHVHIEQRRSK